MLNTFKYIEEDGENLILVFEDEDGVPDDINLTPDEAAKLLEALQTKT